MLERNELMSSRMSGSEEALGTLTCQRLANRESPRLLIGGYGMGFTLRAILAVTGKRAQIVVAELVPGILEWARGPMQAMTGNCLDDPRVEIVIDDVAAVMAKGGYDAIMLDVDNGPDGVTRPANDGLYTVAGLSKARAAAVRSPKSGTLKAIHLFPRGGTIACRRHLPAAGTIVILILLAAGEKTAGQALRVFFSVRRTF